VIRYRFSDFTLSPQRRLLLRDGREVPLIPRYFDLLLLLIERRREAVHRNEIFDRVWGDVTVSDSALSQAVRTIRRTLDDDPREPRFIRTVSRHGYQFVFAEVIEEDEGHAARPHEGDERREGEEAHEGRLPKQLHEPVAASARAAAGAGGGVTGGALAGIVAGAVGGLVLTAAPGSTAPFAIVPVLAVIGGGCGAIGGVGVGAGAGFADATAPTQRALALTLGGALGGGLVGLAVQWLTRWALSALVGLDIRIGGGLEGLVIGAGAGLGLAIATVTAVDAFLPRWGKRPHAAVVIALFCGIAGLAMTLTGHPLAGGTIQAIAEAAEGSRVSLAPLGRLIGETDFGPLTSAIIAFGEAATFGVGLTYGLVRRPST
jgi:DNA-binding winged helix-turn-helix (wHTH) protein